MGHPSRTTNGGWEIKSARIAGLIWTSVKFSLPRGTQFTKPLSARQCRLHLSPNGHGTTSSTPEATIQRAVLNRLSNMPHRNPGLGIEVSDGTSDLQYPVVRSRAQALLLHSALQQTFRLR
jgi:hypothetical protein